MRSHRHRLLHVLLFAQCCGSSCGDPHEPNVPSASVDAPVPHLATREGSLAVDVRVSRPEIDVDCGMSGWTAPVDDATFGAASSFALTPAPRPLYAAPATADSRCRLVAISIAGSPPVVLRTSSGYGQFFATTDPKTGLRIDGSSAPLAAPTSPPSACAQRAAPRWGEATLTGNVALEAVDAGEGEGCSTLRLRSAAGPASGALAWPVCLGSARLPFAAGESLRIETNTNAAAKTRLVRIERAAAASRPRVVLWLFRGDPSKMAQSGWDTTLGSIGSSQQRASCAAPPERGCATVEVGVRLYAQVEGRSVPLDEGESATLLRPGGPTLELHVGRAIMRPVVDTRCSKDEAAAPIDVGLVVVERGDKKPAAVVAGG